MERTYSIAYGPRPARRCKDWMNREVTFGAFIEKVVANPIRTGETMEEYLSWKHGTDPDNKAKADAAKDQGGFFLGNLKPDPATDRCQRRNEDVDRRSMFGFDIDGAEGLSIDDVEGRVKAGLPDGAAYAIYPTHSHSDAATCLRVLIPTDRDMAPDEYEPCARKIAEICGILDLLDTSCLDLNRMYFLPSIPSDAPYDCRVSHGETVCVDDIRGKCEDWRDPAAWPRTETERKSGVDPAQEVQGLKDPRTKDGYHGAFCRVYPVEDAIDKFLPDVYEKGDQKNRYTYTKGTTANGLAIFGLHAYSYHNTDPAGDGHCHDAFELVMIHKFGKCEGGTERNKAYKRMIEFAMEDGDVRDEVIRADFGELVELADDGTKKAPDWLKPLLDKRGNVLPDIAAIQVILENDPRLKGGLWYDAFRYRRMCGPVLPWRVKRGEVGERPWIDSDNAALRAYLKTTYRITKRDYIKDAVENAVRDHAKHPVREYLLSLKWDGKHRVDTVIIRHVGAEDTPLNRAMTRKMLLAAVARVMTPGCPFDHCLTLVGEQGIGKSKFFQFLAGREWYKRGWGNLDNADKAEDSLRGKLIAESAELVSVVRSAPETVKSFIDTSTATFRRAYAEDPDDFPRQCVLVATTNDPTPLKGDDGNRRFWILPVSGALRSKEYPTPRAALEALQRDRDQIWAEAVHLWQQGENLELDDDMELEARARQEEYNDHVNDPAFMELRTFLDILLPEGYYRYSEQQVRSYFSGVQDGDYTAERGTIWREYVCPMEFVHGWLRMSSSDNRATGLNRKAGGWLRDMGWEQVGNGSTTAHVPKGYGKQRIFKRPAGDRPPADLYIPDDDEDL